jgi:hypothetical protein
LTPPMTCETRPRAHTPPAQLQAMSEQKPAASPGSETALPLAGLTLASAVAGVEPGSPSPTPPDRPPIAPPDLGGAAKFADGGAHGGEANDAAAAEGSGGVDDGDNDGVSQASASNKARELAAGPKELTPEQRAKILKQVGLNPGVLNPTP